LAVIGKTWLSESNEYSQRRIDFPDDWVNIELSTALRNPHVVVVPVLVDGATMPPPRALPPELQALAARHAVHLRHDAWDESALPLLKRIEEVLNPSGAAERESTDLSMLELFRQGVLEALNTANMPAGQVLLASIDEISRLLPEARSRPDTKQRIGA